MSFKSGTGQNDPNACVSETAKAIVNSGRQYPNEIWDADHKKLIRKDVWVSNQLYELPGDFPLVSNDFTPPSHPLHYSSVSGSLKSVLEHHYKGALKPTSDATLYGNLKCVRNGQTESEIGRIDYVAHSKQELIKRISEGQKSRHNVTEVSVKERRDIAMTEIGAKEQSGYQTTYYIPNGDGLSQKLSGVRILKAIRCSSPYMPEVPISLRSQCFIWIYLGPGIWIEVGTYQQFLVHLPVLHDSLLNTLTDSRRL